MESYVHMLSQAQTNCGVMGRLGPITDLDANVMNLDVDNDDDDDAVIDVVESVLSRAGQGGALSDDVYRSQCASTCSSESAANSFDIRLYPHNPPNGGHDHQRLVSSNPSLDHRATPQYYRPAPNRTSPLRSVVEASEVNASAAVTIATDISPDSAIVVDSAVTDDQLHSKSVVCASPLTHLVRLSSLAFKREGASPADPNLIRSSLPGKFFQRFRGNGTGSGGGVHSTPQYYYTPLTGFDGGSLRRSNSHGAIKSLPENENGDYSYWLSSDHLRQHAEQLNQFAVPATLTRPHRIRYDSPVQIGDSLEQCDANSAASGDRLFPTSFSDLDTFNEKNSSTSPSISPSSRTPSITSSGQKMLSASDSELSSEVESIV